MLTDFDNDFYQPPKNVESTAHTHKQTDNQTGPQTDRQKTDSYAGRQDHTLISQEVMRSRPTWARSSLKNKNQKDKRTLNKQTNQQTKQKTSTMGLRSEV